MAKFVEALKELTKSTAWDPKKAPRPMIVKYVEFHLDCECCGWYTDTQVEIFDGKKRPILTGFDDGHLGGGCWSGNKSEPILWALRRRGIPVSWDSRLEVVPSNIKYRNEYSLGFRQLEEEPIEEVLDPKCDIQAINISAQFDEATEDDLSRYYYPRVLIAEVTRKSGDSKNYVFKVVEELEELAEGEIKWDGDYFSLLRHVTNAEGLIKFSFVTDHSFTDSFD